MCGGAWGSGRSNSPVFYCPTLRIYYGLSRLKSLNICLNYNQTQQNITFTTSSNCSKSVHDSCGRWVYQSRKINVNQENHTKSRKINVNQENHNKLRKVNLKYGLSTGKPRINDGCSSYRIKSIAHFADKMTDFRF